MEILVGHIMNGFLGVVLQCSMLSRYATVASLNVIDMCKITGVIIDLQMFLAIFALKLSIMAS